MPLQTYLDSPALAKEETVAVLTVRSDFDFYRIRDDSGFGDSGFGMIRDSAIQDAGVGIRD
jgi:hypothetical protein